MEKKRLLGIQALRGLLAMLVFLQHVFSTSATVADGPTHWLYLPNLGGVGVMVFFALSGYVMAQKLDDPPGKFLLERVRRVYPPLWISLIFAGLATAVIGGQTGLTWQVFLLLPAGSFPTVPMPYWTLYWEVIFYLLVVVTMFIGRAAFWGGLFVWAVAGMILWHRPWGQHLVFPGWYDVAFNPFAVYFLSGALAYHFQGWFSAAFTKASLALAMVLLFAVPMMNSATVIRLAPTLSWLSIVAGAFFAIIAAVHWEPARGKSAFWVRMGDWSYGFYLVHVVPMILAAYVLKTYDLTASYWVSACVLALTAFPLAVLMGKFDVSIQRWIKGAWSNLVFTKRREAYDPP